MRILFVAATFPYPLNSGSSNLIYHWLEAASQEHAVDLIVLAEAEHDQHRIPGLGSIGVQVLTPSINRSFPARVARFVSSVVSGIPMTSLVLRAPKEVAAVLARVGDSTYDVVVLADNCVACYAPLLAGKRPVLLLKHSVQVSDAQDTRLRQGRWNPKWLLQQWATSRQEKRSCKAAHTVCCVNREDARAVSRLYGVQSSLKVIPIGVDLSRFRTRDCDPGNDALAFFGDMTWGANIDAARWFVDEVLPVIWRQRPAVQFRIIGKGGEGLRFRRDDYRVQATGRVDEIRQALKDITVGVVPVISGTGIRFKLLEFLSMGVPTVSTSLGLAGTGVINGEHCLVADSVDAFASAVLSLLSNPHLRTRLSQGGRVAVKTSEWGHIYTQIRETLAETARKGLDPYHMAKYSTLTGASPQCPN